MPSQVRLKAIDMNYVVHHSSGLWTHPRGHADRGKPVGLRLRKWYRADQLGDPALVAGQAAE